MENPESADKFDRGFTGGAADHRNDAIYSELQHIACKGSWGSLLDEVSLRALGKTSVRGAIAARGGCCFATLKAKGEALPPATSFVPRSNIQRLASTHRELTAP